MSSFTTASLEAGIESLRNQFDPLAESYGVVGAALSGTIDGQEVELAVGDQVDGPGAAMSAATMCPVGSLTKVLAATSVMRLVDEGRVGLDDPVTAHVPEFHLPDPDLAAQVTVRRLLSHSAGLHDGVLELRASPTDTIQEFIARSETETTVRGRPGEVYSYTDLDYVLLGRLVERATSMPWPEALHMLVLSPLDMAGTAAYLDPATAARIGYTLEPPPGRSSPAPGWRPFEWLIPSNQAWSGTGDLVRLAGAHLGIGTNAVLRPETAALMRQPQIPVPDRESAVAFGLGWMVFTPDGGLVGYQGRGCHRDVSHYSGLWLVPELRSAVAFVAAGGRGLEMRLDAYTELFGPLLAGTRERAPRPRLPVDLAPYQGLYELGNARISVQLERGELWMACEQPSPRAPLWELHGTRFKLRPAGPDRFLGQPSGKPRLMITVVRGTDDDRPAYLHFWSSAARRLR